MVKSGKKLEKVGKVVKNGNSGEKCGKVKKWGKVAKSVEKW